MCVGGVVSVEVLGVAWCGVGSGVGVAIVLGVGVSANAAGVWVAVGICEVGVAVLSTMLVCSVSFEHAMISNTAVALIRAATVLLLHVRDRPVDFGFVSNTDRSVIDTCWSLKS